MCEINVLSCSRLDVLTWFFQPGPRQACLGLIWPATQKSLPTPELDTRTAVSIISVETRKTLFVDHKLCKSTLVLKTFTEEPMQVVGQLNVLVKYGTQEVKLVLIVIGGNGLSLFGHNWLKYLCLDWSNITAVWFFKPRSVSFAIKASVGK